MKYFKKLEGRQIYLSPMSIEDAPLYTRWFNDFTTTDGIGASDRLTTLEGEKKWIQENAGRYEFAIVRQEDDVLIGNCGIENPDFKNRCAEVGLFIGDEENRNRGYGSEVLELLLGYGFRYLNLNNIMLCVYSFNERAIHTYKKVGFREIGRRRQAYFVNGEYHDRIYMDILSEEYFAAQKEKEQAGKKQL